MKRIVQRFPAFFFALMLAACAQMGMEQADTFNKKVVAGYATIQTIADTASAAYEADKLSENDRANVVMTLRNAMAALKVASSMHDADPAGADTKLTATLALLTSLQAYLVTKGGKPS